jgi:predicted transcriptional regulator
MENKPTESSVSELKNAIPLPALLLLSHNQKTVWKWLSIRGKFTTETIARHTGLSLSNTQRALLALVQKGVVQVEHWNDKDDAPLFFAVLKK